MSINTIRRHDQFALLRFVMASLLIVCHYVILVGPIDTNLFPYKSFNRILNVYVTAGMQIGGKVPICFFVLSGLVAYRSYYTRIMDGWSFCQFIKKRFLRIYPLLFISVVFMTVTQWCWFYKYDEWWTGRVAAFWQVIVALSGISVGTVINVLDAVNGPIWYISVLLVCYSVFWCLCIKNNCRTGGDLFVVPILVGLAVQSYEIKLPFLNMSCATGYIGFFFGVILAKILQKKRYNNTLLIFSKVLTTIMIFLVLIYRYRFFQIAMDKGESNWLCFLIMPITIIFFDITRLRSLCSNCFFDYLGQLSFPMYLLHIPTFCLCVQVVQANKYYYWIMFGIVLVEAVLWESVFKEMVSERFKRMKLFEYNDCREKNDSNC